MLETINNDIRELEEAIEDRIQGLEEEAEYWREMLLQLKTRSGKVLRNIVGVAVSLSVYPEMISFAISFPNGTSTLFW